MFISTHLIRLAGLALWVCDRRTRLRLVQPEVKHHVEIRKIRLNISFAKRPIASGRGRASRNPKSLPTTEEIIMSKNTSVIVDLNHVAGAALPVSDRTFYQCVNCWTILLSKPLDNEHCVCGNVSVDVDAGRAGARDEQLLRVLQIAHAG